MTKLNWETEALHGYSREVSRLGMFEVAITTGGAATVGANLFVGSFAGVTVAVSGSFAECERAILHAAKRELLRAGAALGELL